MAYDSNKAPTEAKPDTDLGPGDKPSLGPAQSNQVRTTGEGKRTVTVGTSDVAGSGYTSTERTYGTLVRVGANTKGTGTLKDPLNSYSNKAFPAVQNPSN